MYTRVESSFWTDDAIKNVSDDARTLMLYLFTGPHRNILGCYRIANSYIISDLGWTGKRLAKALPELLPEPLGSGRIIRDEQAEMVLVKQFLKHNPLNNPNKIKAGIEKLNELPYSEIIFSSFLSFLEPLDKPFTEPLREALLYRLAHKERRKKKEEEEPSILFNEQTDEYLLGCHLRTKILGHNPRHRVPEKTPAKLEAWSRDFDRMIRIDKIEADDIASMIDWIFDGESKESRFWRGNILSAGKLRAQYPKLFEQSGQLENLKNGWR